VIHLLLTRWKSLVRIQCRPLWTPTRRQPCRGLSPGSSLPPIPEGLPSRLHHRLHQATALPSSPQIIAINPRRIWTSNILKGSLHVPGPVVGWPFRPPRSRSAGLLVGETRSDHAVTLVPEVHIQQTPRGLACLVCPGRPFAAAGP